MTIFVFCYLAVLIFPTLLVNFQRPNWESAQGYWDGEIQFFNPFPLYLVFFSNIIVPNIFYLELRLTLPWMFYIKPIYCIYYIWGKFLCIIALHSCIGLNTNNARTIYVRNFYINSNPIHYYFYSVKLLRNLLCVLN